MKRGCILYLMSSDNDKHVGLTQYLHHNKEKVDCKALCGAYPQYCNSARR